MSGKPIASEKSGRPILAPEAMDFAPGLLAIQESPPARLPRAVMYTVASLFGILVLWATFGKLDIIASADGKLVPKSYIKVVQPADAGIVKEILVREGELVQAGQVLVRMDPQDAQADANTLRTELAIKSLQLRRIDAELSGKPLQKEASDPDDLYARVNAQYRDRRQAYLDALAQAQETLAKARQDYDSGREVLQKLDETTPILKSQADAYADLGKDGYAPKVMIGDKQRAYLENVQDLRAQTATVAGLAAAVNQASKQVSEVTSKYRSDLQNERIDAETDYRKYEQELAKQDHKSALLELRAPQAGIVKDLSTHTIGTVVSAGTVLLSLVPEDEPLVAEVMVKNDDVGFVHPQQKVKIKLVAYPFQKYGMIDGEVQQLWPDASEEDPNATKNGNQKSQTSDGSPPPSSYKALIVLDKQSLGSGDHTLRLVPGMQVIAEINQGRRTVLEYLLSPVQKTLAESGRER
jgi:HlyD family secretion protein